ncbi:helix-turn-helix transcriptional regulator [Burkholderia ambifaria]|nr:helix-turn-helix transcriptional regulator [Burkholderia ambifaria]
MQRLQSIRESGLSLVGVSPATASQWRSGIQAPERDTLERLANVGNVAPEWFTRASSASVGSQKRWPLRTMQINDLAVFSANFPATMWQKRWPLPTKFAEKLTSNQTRA